jgi:hypothetical protein
MPSFVCVDNNVFFNKQVYNSGDRIFVEDDELIARMKGRFVLESEYEDSRRKVVVNFDRKKTSFTKEELNDTIKEVALENARLKEQLRNRASTTKKKAE